MRSCANIREYWHRPEVNEEEFRDGWLKTGDIGYLDDDGFLFLADRAKDLIIRGGENIYPIEIENELLELDEVKEVAAIGIPHERFGEEVAVVVHLHLHASLDADKLLDYAKSKLAAYKVPPGYFLCRTPAAQRHQQGAEAAAESKIRQSGQHGGVSGRSARPNRPVWST